MAKNKHVHLEKMGHVTIVNEDLSKARQIAEKVKNTIQVISE